MVELANVKTIWFFAAKNYLPEKAVLDFWQVIEEKYQSEDRTYHNFKHIDFCLKHLKTAEHLLIENFQIVQMAVILHEICHNPTRGSSEENCAEYVKNLFRKFLGKHDGFSKMICQLILATDQKRASTGILEERIMHDLELMVFTLPFDKLIKLENDYRSEYWQKPLCIYSFRRSEILANILENKPILRTPLFFEKYENSVAGNMQKLIETLKKNI